MTHLSTTELITATAGQAVVLGDRAITAGLTTDSRAIVPGCVFLALCGERFDGNNFDDSTGNIVLTRQADGSYVAEQGIGVYAYDKSSGEGLGFWDLFNPGITYVK